MKPGLRHAALRVPLIALLAAMPLLPAPAQEPAPPTATPPASQPPASQSPGPTPAATPPKDATAPADEGDTPPDLGENVSADNNVSFPVDI
jgi:rod shape-determining protein MreC